MAGENTLAILATSPGQVQIARPSRIATSLPLRAVQRAVLSASGGGPDFPADQEPLQDGTAYTAGDGQRYYRPQLAVAARGPGMRPGPDVWFLKDDADVISLQFTLELVPFGPEPGAVAPLPITIDSVRMQWSGGFRDFQAPGLEPVEGHAPDRPAFLVRGGAKLRPDEAAILEAQMNHSESACRLAVGYSYRYTVPVPAEPAQPRPPIVRDHRTRLLDSMDLRLAGRRFGSARLTRAAVAAVAAVVPAEQMPEPRVAHFPMISTRIRPDVREMLVAGRISDLIAANPTHPDERTQQVVRSIPFVFEPSDEQNGPVYRALHGAANLTAAWVLGEGGWLSASGFPNSVYRLPDELRLAFDPETGLPRVVPTLHRTADGEPRVRLLARIAPYQDARKLVLVRKLVDMPAGRIVLGQVQSSTLTMGGSFPEELVGVGGGSPAVPLTGFDLTLDLSLSYYQLFCQQIASTIGIPGVVDITLPVPPGAVPGPDGQPPTPVHTHLDLALRLDRVDDLPCTISVPDDQLSPAAITITNAAGVEVTIGGCHVTLLQVDEESVVPVDAYPGECSTAFPITLAAGASAELAIRPDPGARDDTSSLMWNGVLVELFDKRMACEPAVVLKRVHELAGPGEMTREITVTSPVFSTGTLPPRFSQLASIEVEVTGPDGHPASVLVDMANPTRTLAAPIRLADLVGGAPGGISTVAFRVRNNYLDHQGQWSQPQPSSGTDLVAYPNNTDGD